MSSGPRYTRTFRGVAPGATMIDVKVLDSNGEGKTSSTISAIQWVVENRAKHGIRVMNLSFGHPPAESYRTDPLCRAVEKAWAAGIVVDPLSDEETLVPGGALDVNVRTFLERDGLATIKNVTLNAPQGWRVEAGQVAAPSGGAGGGFRRETPTAATS